MNHLKDIFTTEVFQTTNDYQSALPGPMGIIDNFLPLDVAHKMYDEINSIDNSNWKTFTRKGSYMLELNKMHLTPVAFEVASYLNSSSALRQLEKLTGIPKLIPDPHFIGSSYSKSYAGDTLQVHNDFNWNDELQLHRAVSLIIYLTPNWQPEWYGGLDFYNREQTTVQQHVDCLFNRCLIWNYHKEGWHGHTTPLACPDDTPRTTFRLFYYTSNSTYKQDDPPHRSQYWFDPVSKQAYDNREEK